MPSTIKVFVIAFAAFSIFSCEMNKVDDSPRTITLDPQIEGVPVKIELTKGGNYRDRMAAGPMVFNVLPQIVIWVEDGSGKLVDTLYVSGADHKKMNHGGKGRLGAKFYEESFPLWSSKMKEAGKELPSSKNPYPDSVTSATPMSSFTLVTKLPARAALTVVMEINKSGDVNGEFTAKNNSWVGQPALLYKASIAGKKKGDSCELKLVGHSGRLTDKPGIYPDLAQFDSALKQVEKVTVVFE